MSRHLLAKSMALFMTIVITKRTRDGRYFILPSSHLIVSARVQRNRLPPRMLKAVPLWASLTNRRFEAHRHHRPPDLVGKFPAKQRLVWSVLYIVFPSRKFRAIRSSKGIACGDTLRINKCRDLMLDGNCPKSVYVLGPGATEKSTYIGADAVPPPRSRPGWIVSSAHPGWLNM